MAVDREFACIRLCVYSFVFVCFICLSLELILLSLGRLWASFWEPLGRLGLPRGAWDDFGSKMDVQFRATGSQVARLRTKSDLAELSGVSDVSAQWAQSGAGAAAPNPTSLAPGARMT